MAYEHFKEIKTIEEFYSTWESEQFEALTEGLRISIYNKYIVKCLVFQRDNFTCQNESCPICKNTLEADNLTMHHIKFQKNNGGDKVKNCVTICKGAHKAFHRGKNSLTLFGMTYKIHQIEKIDWKKVISEGRKVRKDNKQFHGYRVSWAWIRILIRFLNIDYRHLQDDEDILEDEE